MIKIGTTGVNVKITGGGFGSSPIVNLPNGVTGTVQSSNDAVINMTVSSNLSSHIGANLVSVTAGSLTSGKVEFDIDGPFYMTVQSDILGHCSGCSTTVSRLVNYQVMNFGGSNSGAIPICESPTQANNTCTQQIDHNYTMCSAPGMTQPDGTFYDRWGFQSDNITPSGCGIDTTDPWMWLASVSPQVTITYALLQGYIHTDAIKINGVVSPPDKMQQGTIIGH